jgi:DNA processing protein
LSAGVEGADVGAGRGSSSAREDGAEARVGRGRSPAIPAGDACDGCLRRTALIADVSGAIDVEWRRRGGPRRVLALPDEALLELDRSGRAGRAFAGFDAGRARADAAQRGLRLVCQCSSGYPDVLRELEDPPAVLHVLGDASALRAPAVAVVGARRATSYGLQVAAGLGRGLAVSGVTTISGMALGIDSAAHAGALEVGRTIAVLACGADTPYPASKRALHRQIRRHGAVVSELPPGTAVRRWAFVARNRIIAALGAATVLVEAAERSGSLTTADFALALGRPVGAVPGPVTSPMSRGANALLQAGAAVVRDPADVLDLIAFDGLPAPVAPDPLADLPPSLASLLAAIDEGRSTVAALASTPADAMAVLDGLAELELRGVVARRQGGHYVRRL